MRWSRVSYPILAMVLFGLYFGFAIFGLKVEPVSGFATLVWVPSGLSLFFLFKFGLKYWPAVALAALGANYVSDASLVTAAGISIGNTLEPLIGAYILRRLVNFDPSFNSVNQVVMFIILVALFCPLLSASGGVASLWVGGIVSDLPEAATTWLAWWAGDAVSLLVIAPLLLVWSSRSEFKFSSKQAIELTIVIAALILLAQAIFGHLSISITGTQPRSYLVFPLLIWTALRLSQRISTLAVFILAFVATFNTANGFGPFSSGSPSDNLLNLQAYMAVVSGTAMILSAAISEQKLQVRKKDEFISVASHELKTPLTSIKTFTQTLQLVFEKKGDKQSFAHMARVNRQVERLNRLVFKLLDLSRIQEGRITLQKEIFSIGSLVREIVEEVEETTHHKIVIRGSTRTRVVADRDRIGRVLTNLISNAAIYSPDANKIIVTITKKTPDLVLSVQDFGIGVRKQDQEHIFDRYYQVKSNKAESSVSLGLGLYIAKEIIERHEGKIWVRSNPKGMGGSTFCFSLPLSSSKA